MLLIGMIGSSIAHSRMLDETYGDVYFPYDYLIDHKLEHELIENMRKPYE